MAQVYKKFVRSCPELATSKRGKLEILKAYLTKKYNGVPNTAPKQEIHHNIPLALSREKFVGREAKLQELHQLLKKNQQVAIAGMGGVGKTELALQYAHSHLVTYQGGICWLSAVQDVGLQLVQFAMNKLQLNIPDDSELVPRVQYCLTKWPEGEVLLIIDNVTNYRDEVRCYLESVPARFKQLITTREKLQSPIVRLDLDVLTPLEAMQLLKSIIGRERLRREALVARRLCKWLGYLPLGLELVGRYLLGDEELSLADMLQDLENERLKNPALVEVPQEMKTELGVAAAFELSWRRLRENAQNLGCVLSLFALAPIPWELVEGITINNEAQNWKQARRELLQLHLVQSKGDGIYQLHPLLREFFQDKLEGLEQKEEFKRSFCGVMVEVTKDIPQEPTLQEIKAIALVIPHLAEVAKNFIQYVSDEDLICVFTGNAFFYKGQGLYDKAAPWLEQCLETAKQRLGEEHLEVAFSLNNLADLYGCRGRYNEAETLSIQALALCQKLLGEEDPGIALILNNLAHIYDYQGKYSEAKPLLIRSLELTRKALGEENINFTVSLTGLAGVYQSQGKYSEAEPLLIQALALRRKLLGEEHLFVARSLNNLALIYYAQSRYSEAEPLFIQSLELRRKLLGEEHPSVALGLHNLGLLYEAQGRYTEAEPLFIQSLELRRKLLGEEHPDVATSLHNLAHLHTFQGRYTEAESLFTQNLALLRKLVGEEHPDVATSLHNFAELYQLQGKSGKAEALYNKALKLRRKLLGKEHFDVVTTLHRLVILYISQRRFRKAEVLQIQAFKITSKLLGDDNPGIVQSIRVLASIYICQGRYRESELLLIRALDISERNLGSNHPDTVAVRENLGDLRDSWKSQH
ncbi:tetratricopeptide repeat protein [Nostoc spongiaeforme FACHB-130]|uniref:Tetratricopeptide repeat protein n=2 Tax=Nostoc TaxID=1177 RepID=A0ABR8FWV2_9NOSO|nr:tetratricopeptide repeat protein [Nostoc spongiaeforme FACHB-130]